MQRRNFLRVAAATVAALTGCAAADEVSATDSLPTLRRSTTGVPSTRDAATFPQNTTLITTSSTTTSSTTTSPTLPSTTLPPGPNLVKIPIPDEAMTKLPGAGNLLAWTADDGNSVECIRKYVEFAVTSGTRLTFFVTGRCPGWKAVAAELQPLVTSGQIQLSNHTYHHENLTTVSDHRIIGDLQRNHDFLFDTFGVDARPFYRPPYGHRNHHTDRLAASIGYTAPVMWRGVLEDGAGTRPKVIVDHARQWFTAQGIVIGHLNHLAITEVFADLEEIIISRGLQTVTLNDVFIV